MHITETLWCNPEKNRYFLISKIQKIPHGELVLQSPQGQQRQVDLLAVIPFEVTRDEVESWLDSHVGQTTGGKKCTIEDFFNEKQESGHDRPGEEAGPGVRLFSALTGEKVESIITDPKASMKGVKKLGIDMKDLLLDYLSQDESKQEAAKQRMEELKKTLSEHGIGKADAGPSDEPKAETKEPGENEPTVDESANEKTTSPEPDPKEVFRGRLKKILEGTVERLEDLADEVLPENEKDESPSDSEKVKKRPNEGDKSP